MCRGSRLGDIRLREMEVSHGRNIYNYDYLNGEVENCDFAQFKRLRRRLWRVHKP